MKPDLKKKEAELMAAWESEPLREKLAEEIAGAFAEGYTPEDCREYIEEKVLLWALDFLNRPGWGFCPVASVIWPDTRACGPSHLPGAVR